MTTILFAFVLALFLSFCITPLARVMGRRWGAMDLPGGRKMHRTPIPRIGGMGIFTAFVLTLTAFSFIPATDTSRLLILLLLVAGAVLFVRRLGYFDYISSQQLYTWMKDLTEETGISRERRSFLSQLFRISRAVTIEEVWAGMEKVFALLEVDQCMLYLGNGWTSGSFTHENPPENAGNRRITPLEMSSICLRETPSDFKWLRPGFEPSNDSCSRFLYRLELPLTDTRSHHVYGTLVMIKDGYHGTISHYSLKRIEHLRRATVNQMAGMSGLGNVKPAAKASIT